KLLSAVYAIGIIFLISNILSQGLWFLQINYFSQTPFIVIAMVLAVAAIYGAYLGIEVIARQTALATLAWYVAFLSLFLLVSKDIDPGNLRPVLENGMLPVLK